MKSSSPPRKKFLKDFNVKVATDDIDNVTSSWMVFLLLNLTNFYVLSLRFFIYLFFTLKLFVFIFPHPIFPSFFLNLFFIFLFFYFYSFLIGQLKYPSSALNSFEKIINYPKSKKIVMFLDYDGTLSPIVDDPDRALMPDAIINCCSLVVCAKSSFLPFPTLC